jgi:hypothetical protein
MTFGQTGTLAERTRSTLLDPPCRGEAVEDSEAGALLRPRSARRASALHFQISCGHPSAFVGFA